MGLEGLASVDAWAIASIVLKALQYGAVLLAMGGALFVVVFGGMEAAFGTGAVRLALKIAVVAAGFGLVFLAARFGLRAARISGMGAPGAVDPMMLSFVWQSPLGDAALWRGAGFLAVLALPHRAVGRWIGAVGALLLAISFALVGHSLGEPRVLLAALVTLHVLAAGFWIGALPPLYRAAATEAGAPLLHRFGVIATVTVGMLVVAGAVLVVLLSGSFAGLFETAYGAVLLAKLFVVALLLTLAARNKMRLVPDLQRGAPGASQRLRRAIAAEGVAVAAILLLTAALTTITTPPVNL